jgi:hypothetical protein
MLGKHIIVVAILICELQLFSPRQQELFTVLKYMVLGLGALVCMPFARLECIILY